MSLAVKVENKTLYDTQDLARFFAKGLRAMGASVSKTVRCVPIGSASRGIGYVGHCEGGDCRREGNRNRKASPRPQSRPRKRAGEAHSIVLALPIPSKMTLRRLARLFEHEVLHTLGKEHDDMTTAEYWSLGPVPTWARGSKVRYDNGHVLK